MTEIRIDEIRITLQGSAQDASRLAEDLRTALGAALQEQHANLAQARTGLVPEIRSNRVGGTAQSLAQSITQAILKAAE